MGLAYRFAETLFMTVHAAYRPFFEFANHSDRFRGFLNWSIRPWMPDETRIQLNEIPKIE